MALSWFKNHQTADVLVYMIDGNKKRPASFLMSSLLHCLIVLAIVAP